MTVPANFTNGPTSPSAYDLFDIVPSDTVDLAVPARALWVSVTGNVKVRTLLGNDKTIPNVPVGFLPVAALRVFVTGTTATVPLGAV